ncbi:MAG TPA: right-handed parallel beta-helix repeat-containing protein [Anaerolineae bacterium]|nr:right-handed parallel beta-helix repeat-containing protein [Anaerolineae bacterium]
MSHNEIMSNTGEHGGGIAIGSETTTVTLDANRIIANRANQRGGGILIWPDTVFTLTNNIIAENSAEELGGGICISDAQGTLVNNTIAQNEEGAGEGIYLAGSAEVTILNNIIVSHTYGIYNAGSGTPDVTYNDVWGNSVSDYHGVTPGVGNISSDPRFVDADNWDYHLWLHSPAVNAGNPDDSLAPLLDIDGDRRPFGPRVDMGADEVPFEVRIWKSVEPESAVPGGVLTYTIHLANDGEESAAGLVITDRVPLDTSFAWALDGGQLVGDEVRWTGLTAGPGENVTVRWGAMVTDDMLVEEVVNESYGVLCSEVPEAVMGETLPTPILRHKLMFPLGMKDALQ